jgi:hypothetical protein
VPKRVFARDELPIDSQNIIKTFQSHRAVYISNASKIELQNHLGKRLKFNLGERIVHMASGDAKCQTLKGQCETEVSNKCGEEDYVYGKDCW